MTIEDLLTKTMSSPDLLWVALGVMMQTLQTIFIVISAIVVIFQVRQWRQESIENRIAGLRTALDVLKSDAFNQVSRQAMEEKIVHGVNWRRLLDEINLVALLISEEYTDESLLLKLKGSELAAIGKYIQEDQVATDLKTELDVKYKPAVDLMNRASAAAK